MRARVYVCVNVCVYVCVRVCVCVCACVYELECATESALAPRRRLWWFRCDLCAAVLKK